jgi:hypothetical protein
LLRASSAAPLSVQTAGKTAVAGAGVKLYTLDCGHMEFNDMGIFADTASMTAPPAS